MQKLRNVPRALNGVGCPVAATVLGTGEEVESVTPLPVTPNLLVSVNELASVLVVEILDAVPNWELGS